MHIGRRAGGVGEAFDNVLALLQGPVRVAQDEAGEVGIESVQLRIGDGQAPQVGKPVGELQQLEAVLLGLQELLPSRDYILISVIDRQNHHSVVLRGFR